MSSRRNARSRKTETPCNLCGLHHESAFLQGGRKKKREAPAAARSRSRRSPPRRSHLKRAMSLGDLPNGCSVHGASSVGSDDESSVNLNHLERQVMDYIVDQKPAKRHRKHYR